MIRLVVRISGRRVFGWAYDDKGQYEPHVVQIRQGDVILDRRLANLSLRENVWPCVPREYARFGYDFLVDPKRLLLSEHPLVVAVEGDNTTRVITIESREVIGRILEFHVDDVSHAGFHGWCWNPLYPNAPQTLLFEAPSSLERSARFRMTIKAHLFREDLVRFGLVNGHCGFRTRWPTSLSPASRRQAVLHLGDRSVDLGAKYSRLDTMGHLALPGGITSF